MSKSRDTSNYTNDNVTKLGNQVNGISQLVQTDASGRLPAIDGSQLTGLTSGLVDPMTLAGDIIVRDIYNVTARLGVGTNGQVLGTNGTTVSWITNPAGVTDHTLLNNIGVNAHAQIDTALIRLADTSGINTGDQTDITGNAGTVTNGVYTTDIGTSVQAYDANTAKLNVAQTFTATQAGAITTDNDVNFDLGVTNYFKSTPTAGFTLTFTNFTAGRSGIIILDNSGAWTPAKAANVKADADFLTTIAVAGVYQLGYIADGTNVYVTYSKALV